MSVMRCVCFYGLGVDMTPGSVVGWFEDIIKVMCLFTYLVGRFLGTLGSLVLSFEGLGSRSEHR